MYIDIVPNRNSPPAILLRESIRDGVKIRKRTLANLSALSLEQAYAIRRVLKEEAVHSGEPWFDIIRSRPHGHVAAVLTAMKRLRLDQLLGGRPCREKDLIKAMLVSRILRPNSKLATTRTWGHTTLGESLGVEGATEDELYAALDWLFERQEPIEGRLAKRHLREGGRVLYDLSSSYFEGTTCPLAARGYNRDGKQGKLQVNYGLMTNPQGCPVALSVFAGNISDPQTLLSQVDSLQGRFALDSVILVGDRGMISQRQIDELKQRPGMSWITAVKSGTIRQLLGEGAIQLDLFDERNLFELQHPDFPGERLIACRNPQLARLRTHKRDSLIEATCKELERVRGMVQAGRLKAADKIGVRVGRVINKYKVAKHFQLEIEAGRFEFRIDADKVAAEAALDGLYVIRAEAEHNPDSADDLVRHYKGLSRVEQAFRSLKGVDLQIRPIYHRLENRVRAHLFLCMLAYYVKWHLLEAWRPLLFSDEEQERKAEQNPVAPARRSASAERKAASKQTAEGVPVHSFGTLIDNLATIVRNTCRRIGATTNEPCFILDTRQLPQQENAYNLLLSIGL